MSALHFDPRTKLALLLLCVLCAMFSPNLCYQFALVVLIGFFAASCGKACYALRGIIAYALICVFTVWCMGVMSGTWRTMFVAFLGLLHKVYACGMLAGVIIGTTRVNEFLSAMERLHCPKKLTIPIAVMLRYLPTIHEDWHFIKDAMRLRDVSPTLIGFLKAPAMTVNCIYVPLLTAASKAADELSIASVTRGIENPNKRTCLVNIRITVLDWMVMACFAVFLATAPLWEVLG
jgi:energy-coupling factor transporter transmembrane protein EcfT